jgi:hypothetical protein
MSMRRFHLWAIAITLSIFAAVNLFFWLAYTASASRESHYYRTRDDDRAFTSVDAWYSPPPGSLNFAPLAKDRYAPVTEACQSEAQALLVKVPLKQTSTDEAARFAGKKLPSEGVHVLLRGVVLIEGTGGFDVGVSDKAVHVHHGCLGRHAVPMKRKALVAVLPRVPEVVYVSCGMAE